MSEQKPAKLLDEHSEYLDELRESGVTNMYGAGPYLCRDFGLREKDAREILSYWMHTFGDRHRDLRNST